MILTAAHPRLPVTRRASRRVAGLFVVLTLARSTAACAVVNGLSGDDTTGKTLTPCTAHRDCYGYCSVEGCLSFSDITFYTSYLPCEGNIGRCNRQEYPQDNGLTCPRATPCTCVNDTCLASTGVGCAANADCGEWQFCNITDYTCTYTFNCSAHVDCPTGVCTTEGCSYGAAHQKPCASGLCGVSEICINDLYCWQTTGVACVKNADCGDGGYCSHPQGKVCLLQVLQ